MRFPESDIIYSRVRPPVRFLDDADNAQYLDKRKRHSGDSSLEGQSLSAGWASTSSSPLLENSQQRLGRSRGMRLLARDDRRAGLKSEEDHSPRRFFTEVEENLPTVRQAL